MVWILMMQYQGVIVTLASGKFVTWYSSSLGLEINIKIQVLPSVSGQKLGSFVVGSSL
jgi:hypothetical protein